MWGIFAGLGLALGIGNSIFGASQKSKQLALQREQLELQKKQAEIQENAYYDSLTSNYYGYMSTLEDMRSAQGSSQLAINQAYEDIASNQLYLDRWKDEYRNQLSTAQDTAWNAYAQQAAAIGTDSVNAGATGGVGGSAALVADVNKQGMRNLVGDSLKFNLNDNPLAAYINGTAQDLLAERQTASSAIDVGYKSIGTYQDAIRELGFSIESMEGITGDIKKKLQEKGRYV